jgi:hypothetical protein
VNDPVRTFNELNTKFSSMKDQQSRNAGKEESLKEQLLDKGFKTVEKAIEHLTEAKKELSRINQQIDEKTDQANQIIAKIESR